MSNQFHVQHTQGHSSPVLWSRKKTLVSLPAFRRAQREISDEPICPHIHPQRRTNRPLRIAFALKSRFYRHHQRRCTGDQRCAGRCASGAPAPDDGVRMFAAFTRVQLLRGQRQTGMHTVGMSECMSNGSVMGVCRKSGNAVGITLGGKGDGYRITQKHISARAHFAKLVCVRQIIFLTQHINYVCLYGFSRTFHIVSACVCVRL